MKKEKLTGVFNAACDACTAGLKSPDPDGKAALVKSAVELLKFSGFTVEFESSDPAKNTATVLQMVMPGNGMPPDFDDEKKGAVG